MRLTKIISLLMAGGVLSACATTVAVKKSAPPPRVGSPNPFAYMKKSAVCKVDPIKKDSDGNLSTTMTVRSDGGLCEFKVSQSNGKAYISFGVEPPPDHGKAFLYSLDNDTHVTYTPTLGYAGQDKINVSLLPAAGQKRDHLVVIAHVDATGVPVPYPITTESNHGESKHRFTRKRRHRAVSAYKHR